MGDGKCLQRIAHKEGEHVEGGEEREQAHRAAQAQQTHARERVEALESTEGHALALRQRLAHEAGGSGEGGAQNDARGAVAHA